MSVEQLSRVRFFAFLISGIIIAGYGVLAIVLSKPNPVWPWIPTLASFLAIAIIQFSARRSGEKVSGASFDELFDVEWGRALGLSYWVAIAMYPLFAVLLVTQTVGHWTAFAAMGTMSGGAPLLIYCFITMRS